jgi:hypothetical protein
MKVVFDEDSSQHGDAEEFVVINELRGPRVVGNGTYPLSSPTSGWHIAAPITEATAQQLLLGKTTSYNAWFLNKAYVVYSRSCCQEYAVYLHDWSWYIISREL